jgi:hypothetical protein
VESNWVHSALRLIVPAPGDYDHEEFWWNDHWQGKSKYSEKIWPSTALVHQNANQGRRGGKPAISENITTGYYLL